MDPTCTLPVEGRAQPIRAVVKIWRGQHQEHLPLAEPLSHPSRVEERELGRGPVAARRAKAAPRWSSW